MDYLRILEHVRALTGDRGDDRFPAADGPVAAFRKSPDSPATVFVFDAQIAKHVLESPAFRQFSFLDRILSIAKPERTHWIRRFCDVGLIMIDGPEHARRRTRMATALDRCVERVKQLPADRMASSIATGRADPAASADRIAQAIVCLLFSESLAGIVGRAVELPHDRLFEIDFFKPFPTLSSLARCNAAIDACCEAIGGEALDADDQAAVLSMLIMGVSPLHALITASMNEFIRSRQSGMSLEAALGRAAKVDSYATVPTNFVMRECVQSDTIAGETVAAGDVVYLFLGSATGCPFSRQTAVPFGAGTHYCSGAKLTSVMLRAVKAGLAAADHAAWDHVAVAQPEQGKASAFLIYPLSVR